MSAQPIPPSSPEEALAGKQLTPRMLRVLAAAADEAERRGHSFVGTEHTLLGLLSERDGIAGMVLTRLGAADPAAKETRKIMDSEGYDRPQPEPGDTTRGGARASGLPLSRKDKRDATLSSAWRRAGRSTGIFERFSESARRVLGLAREEARSLGVVPSHVGQLAQASTGRFVAERAVSSGEVVVRQPAG
jgi:ATP-dependent Clp protease ATP-binding subunit ClpA